MARIKIANLIDHNTTAHQIRPYLYRSNISFTKANLKHHYFGKTGVVRLFLTLLCSEQTKTPTLEQINQMKTKTLNLVMLLFIASLVSSCVSTNRGFQSSPVVSRNVELDPIKADLIVNEEDKLLGESTSAYFLFFRVSGDKSVADGINFSTDASASLVQKYNPLALAQSGRLNKVRGAAAFKALSTGEYDVLVHPNYVTTLENYFIFKKYTVTVTGYGASYSNFRTEKQKIVILENGNEIILQD